MELEKVVAIVQALEAVGMAGCNGPFQHLVASRIEASGKPVEEFTIGEMTRLIQKASEDFNLVLAEKSR